MLPKPKLHFSLDIDDPKLPAVLTALGVVLTLQTQTQQAANDGSSVDPSGLAILDAKGAAIVAEPRNASPKYLAGLRLIASDPNLTQASLLKAIGGATLAGHRAATTKRVMRALGGKQASLFRIGADGTIVVMPQTRQSLAQYFGLAAAA